MGRIITDIMESHKIHVPNHQPVNDVHFFVPCCMTHSASHAPMDFAIGGGYVQPQRSPREATIRWAFMPPDVSQGRGERRGLPIDAGCGRGREFEESLGQGALRRDG